MNIYTQTALSLAISCALVFAPQPVPEFLAYLSLISCVILLPMTFVLKIVKDQQPENALFKNTSIKIGLSVISVFALVAAGYPKIAAFSAIVCLLFYATVVAINKEDKQ